MPHTWVNSRIMLSYETLKDLSGVMLCNDMNQPLMTVKEQ